MAEQAASPMIGYNITEVNELTKSIIAQYDGIGQYMGEQWPTLQKVVRDNWIGPDEDHYEKLLVDTICALYLSLNENITLFVQNIRGIGQAWKDFQATNHVEGSTYTAQQTSFTSASADINELNGGKVTAYEISTVVKMGELRNYVGVNLGLVNGTGSGTQIVQALTEYSKNVKDKTNTLLSNLSSAKAFLGTQSTKIDTYIDGVGVQLSSMVSNVQTVIDAVNQLTAAYSTMESNVSNSFSTGDSAAQ